MKTLWRHRLAVIAVICSVLLSIGTNLITDLPLTEPISWIIFAGILVVALIAIAADIWRERRWADASAPALAPVSHTPTDAEPEQPKPKRKRQPPRETSPVRVQTLPEFVRGRDNLLKRLEQQLETGGLVVIVGGGGSGKSTVARQLVRSQRSRDSGVRRPRAWEVSATTRRSLINGFRIVAENLNATAAEVEAVQTPLSTGPDSLWQLLDRSAKSWILIIDNADEPQFLAKPKGSNEDRPSTLAEGNGWARASKRGLVIVTSRERSKHHWPRNAKVYRIGQLTLAQAAQILKDEAPKAGSQASARALAKRLGRIPLALHLAGRYLGSEFAVYKSFEAYRRSLEADSAVISVIDPHPSDPDAFERNMVMLTWELSLDALAKKGIPQARPLLRLLSCYAPAVHLPLGLLPPAGIAAFLMAEVTTSSQPRPRLDEVLRATRCRLG